MTNHVLFLCTGNYYRSRFAELLFNHLATQGNTEWGASSRALALELGGRNVGPISPFALQGLSERGIPIATPIRFPRSLQEFELSHAKLVVALKESEHRPMLEKRFPGWESRVEYWHIDDVDVAEPQMALPKLEQQVRELWTRLATNV